MSEIAGPEQLEARLREIGATRYHDRHPFHKLLHGGRLDKGQVQAWALNRFCYQAAIPRKDASLIGRCDDRELRREWIHRISDHDGAGDDAGGIERWLVLTGGLGLDRDYVVSQRGRWVILAPERVLLPDEIAVEILQRCDGAATVAEIAAALAQDFSAPEEEIRADVIAVLQDLADKGFLSA